MGFRVPYNMQNTNRLCWARKYLPVGGIPVAINAGMLETMKTRILLVLSFSVGLCPFAQGDDAATNQTLRSGPSKLRVLEQKAEDRDFLAKRCSDLEAELEKMRSALSNVDERAESNPLESMRRLQDMERKAIAYNGMVEKIEKRDQMIAELGKQLDASRMVNSNMQIQIDELQAQVKSLTESTKKLQQSEKALQSTVEQLLLGNFEYYEVREGDTVESIAQQPTIYGDVTKAAWIRQANRNRVEDIDHLQLNEMLIIPRFPPSGRYEF